MKIKAKKPKNLSQKSCGGDLPARLALASREGGRSAIKTSSALNSRPLGRASTPGPAWLTALLAISTTNSKEDRFQDWIH